MSLSLTLSRNVALSATILALSSVAQAQNAAAPANDALTWNGITLYGIVDVGLQYDTHSAPGNDYTTFTVDPVIQKYSNRSVTALVSNPLSVSRIGLSGIEPLTGDWSAVARVETYFNPTSGDIIDALHGIAQNNGLALNKVNSYADSSNDGELFETALVGISSRRYGTVTFGRQGTLLNDGVTKYDIMEDAVDNANAFSLIGNSRPAAGGGDTQNAKLDRSIKYTATFNFLHAGLLYQVSNADGSANTAFQAQLGFQKDGLSVDAYYTKKYDAISATTLTAAQVAALPPGADVQKSLAGTISDNTAFAIMGSYVFGPLKLSAGYDHLRFADPSTPLAVGSVDANGYVLQVVNNTAYIFNDKVLEIFWAGGKYYVSKQLYVAVSYYGYHQNSYGATSCSSNTAATCSGTENALGVLADYRFNRHFDTYVGGIYSAVDGGLSSGFLSTSTLALTTGLRFQF